MGFRIPLSACRRVRFRFTGRARDVVVPLHVPHVGRHPGWQRVRAADLLDLRSDIEVIQVGVVTAIAADELVRVGVTALRLAADDANGLAPQGDRPELTGLAANHWVNRHVAKPGSRWLAALFPGCSRARWPRPPSEPR